jgi:hypothetical protein
MALNGRRIDVALLQMQVFVNLVRDLLLCCGKMAHIFLFRRSDLFQETDARLFPSVVVSDQKNLFVFIVM